MMAKSFPDQASEYVGETVRNVSQLGATAADAVREGVSSAKRAVSDTRDAAEAVLNEAKRRVKRQPLESILLAAAVGIALGFILGRATSDD
jgi:ElaB/YqjD/DUF883 family membrane-anchored ribosome-binding protein